MKKNNFFVLGMLVTALVFGMAFWGCDNGTTSGKESLNGTWSHGQMTLIISNKNYTIMNAGVNYGKGNLAYTDSSFTLTPTYAWNTGDWIPIPEGAVGTVTGDYVLDGNILTISGIEGTYAPFNGPWQRGDK
jgi:hypothetical protein